MFLTFLKAGKSQIKAPIDSMSGEVLLPGSLMTVFSLCLHMKEGARELPEISFERTLIPFLSALPLWPNHLPKSPDTITLGIRFQHIQFEETQHSFYSHNNLKKLYLSTLSKVGMAFSCLRWQLPACVLQDPGLATKVQLAYPVIDSGKMLVYFFPQEERSPK